MALAILDGTQTATTLSTILSSGQHITAHTVVSLGTQAITDILNATSAGLTNTQLRASAVTIGGTVTVGNSLTISSLPAISGTVTANVPLSVDGYTAITGIRVIGAGSDGSLRIQGIEPNLAGNVPANLEEGGRIPVFGTVTANVGNAVDLVGSGYATLTDLFANESISVVGTVDIGNTITIAGAVTANPTGTQTIAGSVTLGAGTSQIGSVTASISNSVTIGSLPAISGTVTANTFALQGTAVTTSNFTSTTASTVLANYNATREVLTIFNEGAGNLHIAPGATCTTIAYQVRLSSGDYYEVPNHQTTITHSAVFATAGTARIVQIS